MSANSFYPRADTGFGYGTNDISLPSRPQTIGPVLDEISYIAPLAGFDASLHEQSYGLERFDNVPSKTPAKPEDFSDPYLFPMLTRNERLRLTMLWYYTRDLVSDEEILKRMQDKVNLLKSLIGWEFAICGLLENDIYQRLVTAGLPLAILPRRESTCAHTVQQTPGSVFFLPNMANDWRFAQSPHVSQGGLRTYAGAQLRCQVGNDQHVALGSLCIASNTPHQTLNSFQMDSLVKFADMLTEDIINSSRRKRAKQQELNDVLLREAFNDALKDTKDVAIFKIMNQVFPDAAISLVPAENRVIQLSLDGPQFTIPDQHVKSTIWEDEFFIDELLRTNNHKRLKATRPIRAIVGMVRDQATYKALVVATTDITYIFDDVDIRFVEGCAMLLRSVAQERSLQEALSTRERFMRGITHQLRTPIHGILGSVVLLTDQLAESNQQIRPTKEGTILTLENLRMIENSGRELMSTVNSIIKFARWTESIDTPTTTFISDLKKLESDILEDVFWLLPVEDTDRISILFNNTLAPEIGIVQIDMTLLKDCLQSLVLNALQYTAAGSVVITISAGPECSSIIFDVQDTGCGIDSANWHRIFEAYEKGDPYSTRSGLGLSLARKISSALCGTITLVSSIPGEGSHFRAQFPNPGFACSIDSTKAISAAANALPARFAVLTSDPPSALETHLAHVLKTRGLEQSEDVVDALTIVSFTHLYDQYEKLLHLAEKSLVTISFVPAGSDLSRAKETHHEVLFFSGPFTTSRIDEILLEVSNKYMSRAFPKTTEQALVSKLSMGAGEPYGEDLSSTDLSSRSHSMIYRSSTPNCLLVDDNVINLRIMRMFCDKRSFPYVTAANGLQAIERYKDVARGRQISLILLDLQMPICDGIQACIEIRAFEAMEGLTPAIIFIITGQDSPSDRTKSSAAGADDFFVKPLALKSLDRSIARIFVGTA